MAPVTLPMEPDDAKGPRPQWWWDAATEGARQASAHLQQAITQSLRSRSPRIVEAVGVYRDKGLVAVTADTTTAAPHVLRHTFCTHLADSGADVGTIRELAGHSDIRTTTVYTAVSTARLEDAVDERHRQRRGARRAAR